MLNISKILFLNFVTLKIRLFVMTLNDSFVKLIRFIELCFVSMMYYRSKFSINANKSFARKWYFSKILKRSLLSFEISITFEMFEFWKLILNMIFMTYVWISFDLKNLTRIVFFFKKLLIEKTSHKIRETNISK